MEDSFSIDIDYRGKELNFEARLVAFGYTHRFYVIINGIEVVYEPDDERNYRAILDEANQAIVKDKDIELIRAVGERLQAIHDE